MSDSKTLTEELLSGLPDHIRVQLKGGVVDPGNIPLEDLRRMAIKGAADGEVVPVSDRLGGQTEASPLDYVGRIAAGNDSDEIGQLPSPALPDTISSGKGPKR